MKREPVAFPGTTTNAASHARSDRYRVDPAAEIGSGDVVFEAAGVQVVVDPASLRYLERTTMTSSSGESFRA
jgi:Fe-S cluster assembly iron-binding protein IscA